MSEEQTIKAFELKVFSHQRITEDCVATFSSSGDLWRNYQCIKLPGFDGCQTIDLTGFWSVVFSEQPNHYQCDLIGRETIVKWSDTKVLTENFTLVAHMTYE